ncbi:MAG TPA: MFS transporter [Candidatus Limnocylindrales bacterium]|nr:MFS transporter [Candidatus Limnocylindrales bacterium]
MRLDPRAAVGAVRELDRPIAVLAAISFISQVGVSVMLPLLPIFALKLGATPRELGLMVSIFAVTQTIGQLGSGVLSSRLSPRRQMPLGQASYAAANFLIATAGAAVPLIAFRAMAGFGGGLSIIAERLYIARVADRARLAFTNGVISAAGSSGSVFGPVIGGFLALSDLRIPFIVVGITATIAGIAAVLYLPPEPETAPNEPASAPPSVAAADAGVAGAGGAGAGPAGSSLGRRLSDQAAAIRPLGTLALWNLGFSAAYGGWITTFGPYAEGRLGLPVNQVTWIFGMFGLGSIFLGPWLSRFADQTGRRRMVAFGTLLVLGNLASMILQLPVVVIYATAVVAGGGLAAANASWFALLTVATDGGRRGRSFGLVTALSNLGVVAGATLASEIWQGAGIDEALLVAAAFLVLAMASLALVRAEPRSAAGVEPA